MIQKHEIPILEFDTDRGAVIMPNHEHIDLHLPRKAVFPFLCEYPYEYAMQNGGIFAGEFESATKKYPIYVIKHKGEDICICQAPVGASAATQLLDWLIGYGVREIISAGSCGALREFGENEFIVPYKALRDEGTSYHYIKPSRFAYVSERARQAIEKAIAENGFSYREVITWTTDGFYRETRDKVAYRMEEGCDVVEMECSALAACAEMRGAVWGTILYTGDTLADADNYDERNWGKASIKTALKLALDAVVKIEEAI